jgi:hypothetical protein
MQGSDAAASAVTRRYKGRACGVPPLECTRDEDDPRPRVYSQFDWYAMVFGRIVNAMATTCLTPVAYMLANRDEPDPKHSVRLTHGGINSWVNRTDYGSLEWYNYDDWLAVPDNHHPNGLAKSGSIIAAVSLGAMISTTAAYFLLPASWKDGKLPFFLGTAFPYLGIAIYITAVVVPGSASFHSKLVIISRVTLALGYGLQFCIKRQIARVATSKRRGDLMLWNNTFDIVGMASGPALVGLCLRLFTDDTVETSNAPSGSNGDEVLEGTVLQTLAARISSIMVEPQGMHRTQSEVMPNNTEANTTAKLLVPAVLLTIVVTINLIGILYGDMDEPFFEDGSGAAIVDAPTETTPLTATSGSSSASASTPADAGKADAPHEESGRPGIAEAASDPAGPPYGPEGPPIWVARSVQMTCISYTFTRVFLRYSYESAMVIVYSQTYHFTDGAAGMIAGGSAFFALIAVFLWHRARNASAALGKNDAHTASTIMLVSECCAFACALVMMITPTISTYLGRHWGVFFTLLTAVFFYPSQVLGASIANSYPLDYAVPSSPWLNRNAILVQQELIMPIGNGCGMMLGRIMTGTNAATYLLYLGISFAGVMLLQFAIVSIGWDPVKTRRSWRRCCGERVGVRGGGTNPAASSS